MTDEKLEKLYGTYLAFSDVMAEDYGALAVAGVMIAQALTIYKSALSPEEFDSMVDNISNSRDLVKTFQTASLQ
jgi:hypothetical protein